ncbi:MAG: hypothetical protein EOM50_04710 [Erysipelotrichia bacterium]|nr:hypothetical protein [Erysipelotrichia bacterium]NCC54302.1 hypothetical protein [Erysipelotrichia bacterium]
MLNFGKKVVKNKIPILIVSVLLLIPSIIGMAATRVNYDMLSYLPSDIETMKGQDILQEDFGKGAFSLFMVEDMSEQDVAKLKSKIEKVKHVDSVIWYDTLSDISVPMSLLPDDIYEAFNQGDTTMMAIFFDTTTSADETMNAINEIKSIGNEQCFLSGMSAVVNDTKQLTQQEEPIYILIAVVLSSIILALFMDSYLVPIFFLLSIGMAILYNLGSNYFIGEVSYITKALAAVLQLGVTMDYSIFLWHSYKEMEEVHQDRHEAMAYAIKNTITSVAGSSLTTVAGFIALCFMSFTLGSNLGIVMAKGVIFGVIGCVTILPAMILVFDKALDKTTHKPLMPKMDKFASWITAHYKVFICIFLILLLPALYGYKHTKVYYDLSATLPKDLDSVKANKKLADEFDMNSTHMILINADVKQSDVKTMSEQMKKVKGVKTVLGLDAMLGNSIPETMIPEQVKSLLKSDHYQLMLVTSEYAIASDEVNHQISELNTLVKKYDKGGMVIGEAPCTKDLIEITDEDFKMVSVVSIGAIFVIILLLLKSISLPIVLVSVIEVAIFINMGIPYYTGVSIPFIASVVIGTIQLGATVDYAILMTTRFRMERRLGKEKKEALDIALAQSIPSIIVSALGFFAATFGVGLYSNVDMISTLCTLMARGAIVSMLMVIFVLPSMFMVFDKFINKKIIKEIGE